MNEWRREKSGGKFRSSKQKQLSSLFYFYEIKRNCRQLKIFITILLTVQGHSERSYKDPYPIFYWGGINSFIKP